MNATELYKSILDRELNRSLNYSRPNSYIKEQFLKSVLASKILVEKLELQYSFKVFYFYFPAI